MVEGCLHILSPWSPLSRLVALFSFRLFCVFDTQHVWSVLIKQMLVFASSAFKKRCLTQSSFSWKKTAGGAAVWVFLFILRENSGRFERGRCLKHPFFVFSSSFYGSQKSLKSIQRWVKELRTRAGVITQRTPMGQACLSKITPFFPLPLTGSYILMELPVNVEWISLCLSLGKIQGIAKTVFFPHLGSDVAYWLWCGWGWVWVIYLYLCK